MYNAMQQSDNGVVVYYNTPANQQRAQALIASAITLSYPAADTVTGQVDNIVFKLVFQEKFITLAYHNLA